MVEKNEKIPDQVYVTMSVVMFTLDEWELKIVLLERTKKPRSWMWALPWWYLMTNKSAEQTVQLKLFKKLWLVNVYLESIGVFSDPKRDPRWRAVNIAYVSAWLYHNIQKLSSYGEVKLFSLKKLPKMPFDHSDIVRYAYSILQKKMMDSNIAQFFLPRQFTLTQLQTVYDQIQWKTSDIRNFRKFIQRYVSLKSTGKQQQNVWHRPAMLYEFSTKNIDIDYYN